MALTDKEKKIEKNSKNNKTNKTPIAQFTEKLQIPGFKFNKNE